MARYGATWARRLLAAREKRERRRVRVSLGGAGVVSGTARGAKSAERAESAGGRWSTGTGRTSDGGAAWRLERLGHIRAQAGCRRRGRRRVRRRWRRAEHRAPHRARGVRRLAG